MIKTAFIVLHYKIINTTINCIDSLLDLKSIDTCQIIVFDNGSNNGSYEKLLQRYADHKIVKIYKSDTNLGFSEGNNSAYRIAKKLNPKYIITVNNDITIKQKDFLSKIQDIYDKEHFFILGPDVYAPKIRAHQSPLYVTFPSLEQLHLEMQRFERNLKNPKKASRVEKCNRYKEKFRSYIPLWMLKLNRIFISHTYNENHIEKHYNTVLHGSCLIFSELYIKENDKLFEPDTKFYHEELLLTLKCKTLGYSILYSPEIQVFHYHGVSTKKSAKSINEYVVSHAQNMLSAFEILEKTIKDNPWQKNH